MFAVFLRRERYGMLITMLVIMAMFVKNFLQGDVPVCTYAQGKPPRCIACHKHVNEQNNEY